MVDFGIVSKMKGVNETYKKIVNEFFESGTTYIAPNSVKTYYKDLQQPQWVDELSDAEIRRMEKANLEFEKLAVTRLNQDVKKEVANMLEEATFVTPNGLNAGIVIDKKQEKVKE